MEGSDNRGSKRKVALVQLARQPPHGFSSSTQLTVATLRPSIVHNRGSNKTKAEETDGEKPHHRLPEEKRDPAYNNGTLQKADG